MGGAKGGRGGLGGGGNREKRKEGEDGKEVRRTRGINEGRRATLLQMNEQERVSQQAANDETGRGDGGEPDEQNPSHGAKETREPRAAGKR